MSYHGMNGLGFTLSPQQILAVKQQQHAPTMLKRLVTTPIVAPQTGSSLALLTRLHAAPVVGPPPAPAPPDAPPPPPPVVEDMVIEEEMVAPEEVATSFITDEYGTGPSEYGVPSEPAVAAAEGKKLPWLWIILAAAGLGGTAWLIMRK